MRQYFARLLRRAANRLDPPRYWGNVLTMNPSSIETETTGGGVVSVRWMESPADALERWRSADRALRDAQSRLHDAETRLQAARRGRDTA